MGQAGGGLDSSVWNEQGGTGWDQQIGMAGAISMGGAGGGQGPAVWEEPGADKVQQYGRRRRPAVWDEPGRAGSISTGRATLPI
jgi:hypothetical protein